METTTINGRRYTVEALETPALTASDLIARGFDGRAYLLRGSRGAAWLAYRTPAGRFELVTKA